MTLGAYFVRTVMHSSDNLSPPSPSPRIMVERARTVNREISSRFWVGDRTSGQAQLMAEDRLPTQMNELYQPVVTIFQRLRIVQIVSRGVVQHLFRFARGRDVVLH